MDNYLLFAKELMEYIVYIDMYTTTNWFETYVFNSTGDYVRLNDYTEISMTATDLKDLDALDEMGQKLYDDNKEVVEKMIRSIIDERYA